MGEDRWDREENEGWRNQREMTKEIYFHKMKRILKQFVRYVR